VDGRCTDLDGPELIDIENSAAVKPELGGHHTKPDASTRHVTSSSGSRLMHVQQHKPGGSHGGGGDADDTATVDHHSSGAASGAASSAAVHHTNDGNLATGRSGNELLFFSLLLFM